MVISISMQMEAGAQPSSGAESPMPPINPKYPDLSATVGRLLSLGLLPVANRLGLTEDFWKLN
jgi:hypothetical protein